MADNQEPVVLQFGKKTYSIYPWDVADARKVGYTCQVWLKGTQAPLVITQAHQRIAYEQLERLLSPQEEKGEE